MEGKEDFYFRIEMNLEDKALKASLEDDGLVIHDKMILLPLSSLIKIIDKRIGKKLWDTFSFVKEMVKKEKEKKSKEE